MSSFEIFFSIPYFCSLQRNVLQSAGLQEVHLRNV